MNSLKFRQFFFLNVYACQEFNSYVHGSAVKVKSNETRFWSHEFAVAHIPVNMLLLKLDKQQKLKMEIVVVLSATCDKCQSLILLIAFTNRNSWFLPEIQMLTSCSVCQTMIYLTRRLLWTL